MTYEPVGFDNAEVMRVPLADSQILYVCNGVALVNFGSTGTDWNRADLTFLVPEEGAASALNVGTFADSTVIVTPATIESNDGSDVVGWGVDSADTFLDGNNNVRVVARTVVKGDGSVNILRVAYQVNILGSVVIT
jgi:hypothetical protein